MERTKLNYGAIRRTIRSSPYQRHLDDASLDLPMLHEKLKYAYQLLCSAGTTPTRPVEPSIQLDVSAGERRDLKDLDTTRDRQREKDDISMATEHPHLDAGQPLTAEQTVAPCDPPPRQPKGRSQPKPWLAPKLR